MARPADPQLRTKLLAASAAEFAEKGYARATIEDITSRAGYSKAAFYLQFESKEAVFRELVADHLAGLDAIVHADNAIFDMDLGLDAAKTVFQGVVDRQTVIMEYLWERRTVARLIVNPPEALVLRDIVEEVFEGGRERYARFVTWAIRQKYFSDRLDPDLAALLFTGAQARLTERIITSPTRPDIPDLVRRAHEALLGGFSSDELRARERAAPPSVETPEPAANLRIGHAQGSSRFFLGDRPLGGGDVVELCTSGGWITGRFEWNGRTDVPPSFHFSIELGGGIIEQQSLLIPDGALLRRSR